MIKCQQEHNISLEKLNKITRADIKPHRKVEEALVNLN